MLGRAPRPLHPYHDPMPTKTLKILPRVILSLALATTVSAQAASYTFQNQLSPYKNPNPAMLNALTLPKIGTKLRLQVPFSWVQRNGVGANSVLATGPAQPVLERAGVPGLRVHLGGDRLAHANVPARHSRKHDDGVPRSELHAADRGQVLPAGPHRPSGVDHGDPEPRRTWRSRQVA